MHKKTLNKIIIMVIPLIFILGFWGGFYPLEQNIITRNVKAYVIETYGFTPSRVQITTLFLWFPVTVLVEVEEYNFSFTVRTRRFCYDPKHFIDNCIERMAEYILTRDLRAYVESVTNGQGRVNASVTGGFILPSLRENLSITDMENPDIVFEKLYGTYSILISLGSDIIESIYDFDFDLMYSVYSRIFEFGLTPSDIAFTFRFSSENNPPTFMSVNINRQDFSNINSPEDFKPFAERGIEFSIRFNIRA
jgi:hypothetical protein